MEKNKFEKYITNGIKSKRDGFYNEALNYFEQASKIDRYNFRTYEAAAKVLYLKGYYLESMHLWFLSVLILTTLPQNPNMITEDYHNQAFHVANAKLKIDNSLIILVCENLKIDATLLMKLQKNYELALMGPLQTNEYKIQAKTISNKTHSHYIDIMTKFGLIILKGMYDDYIPKYAKKTIIDNHIDELFYPICITKKSIFS